MADKQLKPGARYYVAKNNPEGGFFSGVPLRDLTEEEYNALPEGTQRSVDASDFYRATKPEPDKPKQTVASKPKEKEAVPEKPEVLPPSGQESQGG